MCAERRERVSGMAQGSSISLEKLSTADSFSKNVIASYLFSVLNQLLQISFLHFLQISIHLLYFSSITLLSLGSFLLDFASFPPAFACLSLDLINTSDYLIRNITF